MNNNLNNIEGLSIVCKKTIFNKIIMEDVCEKIKSASSFSREDLPYSFVRRNFITRGVREDEDNYYIECGTSFFGFERKNCFCLVDVLTKLLSKIGLKDFNVYYLLLNNECYLTNDTNNVYVKKYIAGDYSEEFISSFACDTLEEVVNFASEYDSTLKKCDDKYILYKGELYNIYVTNYIDFDNELFKESMAYYLEKLNSLSK